MVRDGLVPPSDGPFTAGTSDLDELRLRLIEEYASYETTQTLYNEAIGEYVVRVHCGELSPLIAPCYTAEQIDRIAAATVTATHLRVDTYPHGTFISAADTNLDRAERTNYDAVWLRDSLWGYLALSVQPSRVEEANRVLLTQLDYLASQRERMDRAIAHPELVNRPGRDGEMDAVHIRFNPRSPIFGDVEEDGYPQPWTHKQNDALGLLLDVACSAALRGDLPVSRLAENGRLDALGRLVGYLDAVQFHEMEDSGSWEEIPRRNASSIGLVTSGLERVLELADRNATVAEVVFAFVSRETVSRLVEVGYQAVLASLAAGGESPGYPTDDPRHRELDAALLNLVYPAQLKRLPPGVRRGIVDKVVALSGEFGIRRYWGDNYQSANFWFHDIRTDTSQDSHAKREASFIEGTEAEWFFDSWVALAYLILHDESHDPALLAHAARHTGRALGQITPKAGKPDMLAADGHVVPPFALPESYNKLRIDGIEYALPSPITPLNWSKAALVLLLDKYRLVSQTPRSGR